MWEKIYHDWPQRAVLSTKATTGRMRLGLLRPLAGLTKWAKCLHGEPKRAGRRSSCAAFFWGRKVASAADKEAGVVWLWRHGCSANITAPTSQELC